jgi:hypothetical protein
MTYPTTHGRYYEPEFQAWKNMIARCTNPRWSEWYGNVTVCDAWIESYEEFLEHAGRRPSAEHTLDRKDSKGNYEPGNVRWVTRTVQSRNTKNHKTNKTGARGVSWSKSKGKYRVAIYVADKQHHVGYFDSLEDAADARKQAEAVLWNEN